MQEQTDNPTLPYFPTLAPSPPSHQEKIINTHWFSKHLSDQKIIPPFHLGMLSLI